MNHAPLVLINLVYTPKVFYFGTDIHALANFLGSLGVQLFFCITGLLFARKLLRHEAIDWNQFFEHRLRRIVPAYVCAVVVCLIVAALAAGSSIAFVAEAVSSIPALMSFGLLKPPTIQGFNMERLLGVNWTLAIEWRFYIILPLLSVLIRRWRGLVLVALASLAAADMWSTQISTWPFFVSGAIAVPLSRLELAGWRRAAIYTITLVALAFILICWSQFKRYGPMQWVAVSVFFFGIVVVRPRLLWCEPFLALGTVSYSFYLLHVTTLFAVLGFVNWAWVDVTGISLTGFTVLVSATIALAVVLSTASYLLIERRFMAKKSALQSFYRPHEHWVVGPLSTVQNPRIPLQ